MRQSILEGLESGTYGNAYAFAWDHEPGLVCMNADEDPYIGGSDELPGCLEELGCDYFDMEERGKMFRRKGFKLKDLEGMDDLQQITLAMSLRAWQPVDMIY